VTAQSHSYHYYHVTYHSDSSSAIPRLSIIIKSYTHSTTNSVNMCVSNTNSNTNTNFKSNY